MARVPRIVAASGLTKLSGGNSRFDLKLGLIDLISDF